MLITANGRFVLRPKIRGGSADKFIAYLSGTAGTAVFTLQYKDELGVWVDLESGVLLVNTQNKIEAGYGASISLNVTLADGATSVALNVRGLT